VVHHALEQAQGLLFVDACQRPHLGRGEFRHPDARVFRAGQPVEGLEGRLVDVRHHDAVLAHGLHPAEEFGGIEDVIPSFHEKADGAVLAPVLPPVLGFESAPALLGEGPGLSERPVWRRESLPPLGGWEG